MGCPGDGAVSGTRSPVFKNACCGGPQEEKGAGRGACTGAGTCKIQTHRGGLQEDGDGLKQQETLDMILSGTGKALEGQKAEDS